MKNKFLLFNLLFFSAPLNSVIYKLGPTPHNPGFFSIFFTVLGALDFYDKSTQDCTGIVIDFETGGLYYDAEYGPNWWNYYFEPIEIGFEGGTSTEQMRLFPPGNHPSLSYFGDFHLSHHQGNELIKKYVNIRTHIQKKIDQFIADNFAHNRVVGVHYRGTDKVLEAPPVPYDEVINLINLEIVHDTNIKIFVATDEEKFLNVMQNSFPGKIIATNAFRSSDGKPVHSSPSLNAYKKGEDALIDCILLSRCSKLYRTSSNLSAVSKRFNPSMPEVLLSKNGYGR